MCNLWGNKMGWFVFFICQSWVVNVWSKPFLSMDDLRPHQRHTKKIKKTFRVYKVTPNSEKPGAKHLLELKVFLFYPPSQKKASSPLLLFIHGGGWGAGSPDLFFRHCRYFALRGIVTASIQYRLKNKRTRTDQITCLKDCKSAMRYLRGHAAELGLDPSKIAVAGDSAGGHLAAALATIDEFNDSRDKRSIRARPDLLILYNPVSDLSGGWGKNLGSDALKMSPEHNIKKTMPPVLLLHGTRDKCVKPAMARRLARKIQGKGNDIQFIEIEKASHAFVIFNYGTKKQNRTALYLTDRFLVDHGFLTGPAMIK
jgi:acetyl esterase/lipase